MPPVISCVASPRPRSGPGPARVWGGTLAGCFAFPSPHRLCVVYLLARSAQDFGLWQRLDARCSRHRSKQTNDGESGVQPRLFARRVLYERRAGVQARIGSASAPGWQS